MRRLLLLAGLAALTLAASCGYGNSPTAPSGLESPPAGATIINVVGDRGTLSFSPDPATVSVGQLVSWHNIDNTTHHVVLNDGTLDAGNISPGRYSAAMTLAAPGPYHCTIHPGMVGSMILAATPTSGATITFGDRDCLNLNCYGTADPTAGATLLGLSPGVVSNASSSFVHAFPISPAAGDLGGTDQVFVGSMLTVVDDGYAAFAGRVNGPQIFVLDYSSLIPGGRALDTLTLGIATDDFQFPFYGQPFTARVNGVDNAELTAQLNAIQGGGPRVQFFTIGLSPSVDSGTHTLVLSIDEGGNGGDGWAVDFITIGATTRAAGPAPVR